MYGYFVSGEFVAFYVNHYGLDALVTALDRIGDGMEAVEALISASGVSARLMDERFMEYLGNRCAPLKALSKNSEFRKALDAGKEAVEAKNWAAAERFFPESTCFVSGLCCGRCALAAMGGCRDGARGSEVAPQSIKKAR